MLAAGLLKTLAVVGFVASASAENIVPGSVKAATDAVTPCPPLPQPTIAPVTPCPSLPQPPLPVTPCPSLPQPPMPVTPCPPLPQPPITPPSPSPSPTPTTPAPVTTPPPPPPAPKCQVAGKDYSGWDLANTKGPLDSCDAACAKTKGCIVWSWNKFEGGTCWLKSRAGKMVDNAGVTSSTCPRDTAQLVCGAYNDIDFVAMDIGNKPAKAFSECCDICSDFKGCTAYAWNNYNGGTCWLKKSVGQVLYAPGVTSSSTVQLWGPVCPFRYDTDIVGEDIGNKPAKDAGVCCDLCKGNSACKAYTWSNFNGGTCWMKSGGSKTVAAKGLISAVLAGN